MSIKALIFDVDGTIADTEETHRQAFNAAFLEHGLHWDWSRGEYAELLRTSGGKERLAVYIDALAASRRRGQAQGHGAAHPRQQDAHLRRVDRRRPRAAAPRRGAAHRRGARGGIAPGHRLDHDLGQRLGVDRRAVRRRRLELVRGARLRRRGGRQEAGAGHLCAGTGHAAPAGGRLRRLRGLGQRPEIGQGGRAVYGRHAHPMERGAGFPRRGSAVAQPGRLAGGDGLAGGPYLTLERLQQLHAANSRPAAAQ